MLNDCATLGPSPASHKLTATGPKADAFPAKATLRAAFDEAVREMARERPMLTNGFYSEIGASVFEASYQALLDFIAAQDADQARKPQLHVVSAPAGGGKTSFSIAMLTALVRATGDSPEPMGGLFLADQRKRADDTYRELSKLLPGQVAIWTADHDAKAPKAEKVTDPAKRFSVDDLERYPVVVVTHEFFKGKRGHKAREWIIDGQRRPRALTFVDERPNDVRVFYIQLSQAEAVLEHAQADEANRDTVVPHLSRLVAFMRDRTDRKGDLEKPTDDAKAWSVSDDLWWFRTVGAGHYAKQNARTVPSITPVFRFARSVAEGYAFIARPHGTRFIGYQSDLLLGHGMVLLDATADIDGVQQVCSWRVLQPTPRARYDNLHIVHVPSFTREKLSTFFRQLRHRTEYVRWMRGVIVDHMEPGQRALVVCKKTLFDNENVPADLRGVASGNGAYPLSIEGRKIALTHWGDGIGANNWKDADAVFYSMSTISRAGLLSAMRKP